MKKDILTLCKAINLADHDGLKNVDVLVGDLMLLRDEVLLNQAIVEGLKKELNIVNSKLALRTLEAPIKLDTYC